MGSRTDMWRASPDGTTVTGEVYWPGHDEAGVFRDGHFTPLPLPREAAVSRDFIAIVF
ncbi:MAG TPA: hypothetical protein VH478_10670 [Trebonia sp.]|jgi:hypothetical protein|nr:hypothetical protein [Trebonia sp.]